jgi:hypothetical protein
MVAALNPCGDLRHPLLTNEVGPLLAPIGEASVT